MAEDATAESDFMASITLTFETGMKLKAKMIERGLWRARTKCPKCGGMIDATLNGKKKHLHMACRTAGCMQMME